MLYLKNIFLVLFLVFGLSVFHVGLAFSQNFREGVKAMNEGDVATAFENFKISAINGNEVAQFFVGDMYLSGYGVIQDEREAVKWLRLSADQGVDMAQNSLAEMYLSGYGVPQDYAKAIKLFRMAAESGNLVAQHNLGNIYFKGVGVPKSYLEAEKWYRLSAEQGYDPAQVSLATLYGAGKGVTRNLVLAYMLSNLAAAQGNEFAIRVRSLAESEMTPEQIAEAQRLSSDWKWQKGKSLPTETSTWP